MEWGLLPLPLLYLSAYFERDRQSYYTRLSAVSRAGAWREWLAYFLAGVREQSQDAVLRLRKLIELREVWRKLLSKSKASASALLLVDELFRTPIITVAAPAPAASPPPPAR